MDASGRLSRDSLRVMTDSRPPWATRLFEERARRQWSQKQMAIRLRDAADKETRARMPSLESLRRYVRDYEAGKHFPRDYAELYCRVLGLTRQALFGDVEQPGGFPAAAGLSKADALNLTAWVESTNTSDEAIGYLAERAALMAESHTRCPPKAVLADVLLLHAQIQSLLRGSRQRLRQARELFRIDADLLAHTCLLLGDVSRDHASAAYGTVAVLCAAEADSSPALAFSAQAQVARWQHRYSDAADLAARGFACSPATSLRVLLAGQEANAAALARDTGRARAALARAEAASTGPAPASAWSCPPARHALYRLGVALHVGDARWALREADAAASYGIERAQAFGTWAHLQVGAAIAHLMLGSVENAAGQLGPVLDLAAEYRLATVVEHMAALNSRLAQRRFRDAPAAAELRERITDFTRGACAG